MTPSSKTNNTRAANSLSQPFSSPGKLIIIFGRPHLINGPLMNSAAEADRWKRRRLENSSNLAMMKCHRRRRRRKLSSELGAITRRPFLTPFFNFPLQPTAASKPLARLRQFHYSNELPSSSSAGDTPTSESGRATNNMANTVASIAAKAHENLWAREQTTCFLPSCSSAATIMFLTKHIASMLAANCIIARRT